MFRLMSSGAFSFDQAVPGETMESSHNESLDSSGIHSIVKMDHFHRSQVQIDPSHRKDPDHR